MNDAAVLALLQQLAVEDGQSAARLRKRLGLSDSELRRLIAVLGNDAQVGGMDLVQTRSDGARQRLWLTPRGKALLASPTAPTGVRTLPGLRLHAAECSEVHDHIAEETPVAVLYNGSSFAVMLASPGDLEDFALGFALSEGIVEHPDEYRLLDCQSSADGIALHGHIPQTRYDRLDERRRSLSGRSGCGLCGLESLQAALPALPAVQSGRRFDSAEIHNGFAALNARQPLNQLSGGIHAAALLHPDGISVREDIGRHNAVDKVIGACAHTGFAEAILLVTSRASYEIVHKAARVGIPIVAAISAPTTLAIQLAEQTDISLVAFARGEAMTVYAGQKRLLGDESYRRIRNARTR